MKSWTCIAVALSLLLSACSGWDDPKTARAQRAAQANGDIVVGAAWPWSGDKGGLWQGVELAMEEINTKGGVLGRKLRIVKEDDESSLVKGRLIAQQFAENPDMVAVIGHFYSYIAVPAAVTYQNAGLLFITPGATSHQLNTQGHDLIFRSIPSNRREGRRIAEYMAEKGYRRVAIYYVKDKDDQNMANFFEQRARELGISIADRRSFMEGSRDFSGTIQKWQDLYQFDALYLGANMPEGAHFIAQARKMGLNVPIVGNDGIDTHQLMEIAGKAAEGVALPDQFVHDENWLPYRRFDEAFRKKYRQPAHTQAALGYDTLHLLAQAIERAGSSEPGKIAQALRATRAWQGAGGEFSFDDSGDIPDKKIGMKVVRGGRFEIAR